MLLKDILRQKTKEVHSISPSASLDDVVTELVRFNIGSLLVRETSDGPVQGIITERDILRAQAAHRAPLAQMQVGVYMSSELITAQPDDDITVAMRLMTTHRVRHLPVIREGELYGLISIGDIVKAHHDELEMENYHMRSYIQGGTSSVAMPWA